ncbi:PREDICTED: ubiquitin carboxyl-terminal hydrolase 37-like [Branchiostoma belcheri]|uniref:Ubiquitin carboxyl-terminal hydrolase 37-like n=1 Tax=Branchiostoma belcheri TaxID=7741 RepID=A0A6P4XP79_BRABE|nr:PREDICTED: ubiquitin carboxyl-terminal hydrolase 37-like [Branchiostoma belcheri]
MVLSETSLPLKIYGNVKYSSDALGTGIFKQGCLILQLNSRGKYVLVVQPNLGLRGEMKLEQMALNKSYPRRDGRKKLVVHFNEGGRKVRTAVLEEGDPSEVDHFRDCLAEAQKLEGSKVATPAGRIVSQRAGPPITAQTQVTPSKKRPRDQENQTPNKSLRQAGNIRTPVKHPGQVTPAKGEQTPIRVPTPRPDSKHTTPSRDSSLSRFRREHGGGQSEDTATPRTEAKLRDNTKQNDRTPRKGNSEFLESAKKKFEAGDEKRKSSAFSLSTSFYSNPSPRNYTIPKRPGLLPAPVPRRPRLAENYSGWSDKNKGLVKSQTHPSLQGFSNLGNTCYMNAILQALRGMETFSSDLRNRDVIRTMDDKTLYRNIAVLFQYCNKPTEKQEAGRKQEYLKNVKTAVSSSAHRFSGYLQHDAHEFLSQCLDQLREDIKKVRTARAKDSQDDKESLSDSSDDQGLPCPVSQNFQFEVIHTIRCKNCNDVVTKQEKFHDLSLTLPRKRKDTSPRSLQDLLDQFFLAEDIEYKCGQCGSQESTVSHQFTKLPRVLILHLKRYNYNHAMSENMKMEQPVFLPLYLTLQSHCTEETSPCLPPTIHRSVHLQTERRTDTAGDHRNGGTSANRPYSFKPASKQERGMESSADRNQGNRNIKTESEDRSQGNSNSKSESHLVPEDPEEIEMQRALLLSRELAAAERHRHNSSFSLDNVSEEEQMRRALENSMVDVASEEAPKPQDLTIMSPCVLTPLNKTNNQKPDLDKSKPSSLKPPPEAKLFSIVGEKNVNGTSGENASDMLDFIEGNESETFEIQYMEEPQTVGLCGGNDNPRYASPEQVKRRHHSEGGTTKLGLSNSSKKKRLSSPGSVRAPLARSKGQRTLGKWLKRNCFTVGSGAKESCKEILKDQSNSGGSGGKRRKEEKNMPEEEITDSSQDDEMHSSTQLTEVRRRKEEEEIAVSSQDDETDSSTQLKEVKRRKEEKIMSEEEITISSQDDEANSSTQLEKIQRTKEEKSIPVEDSSEEPQSSTDLEDIAISSELETTSESDAFPQKTVKEPVKSSEDESESEQDDCQEVATQKKDPKKSCTVTVRNGHATDIVSADEVVAEFHRDLAEDSSEEKPESEATNAEAVSLQRQASSSGDNAADPNNNQDLNNNSEADVESESDKENQQPEEEVVGQGSVPAVTLPDWVTEHAQQGDQSYRQKEDEDFRRAMEESLAMQRQQEEKEEEELRKAKELSLQEFENDQFDMSLYEDMEDEEALVEITRSVEEAEAMKKNAETGDLPYSFRLVSVVNHIGKKSSSGHYISDVYDMQKQTWLKWDDAQVDKTTEKFVRENRQTSGYIFFYMNKDCFDDVMAQTQH